jgi:hypothetical protein
MMNVNCVREYFDPTESENKKDAENYTMVKGTIKSSLVLAKHKALQMYGEVDV